MGIDTEGGISYPLARIFPYNRSPVIVGPRGTNRKDDLRGTLGLFRAILGGKGSELERPTTSRLHQGFRWREIERYWGTISTISRDDSNHDNVRKEKVDTFHPHDMVISFLDADYEDALPHQDDPMVISLVVVDYKVERILVDQGISTNVLYWSTFQKLWLPTSSLVECFGTLFGFVEIHRTVEIETTFGTRLNAKTIPITFTVVNVWASYNAVVSTPQLCMKYSTRGKVGVIRADMHVAHQCYEESLKIRQKNDRVLINFLDLNPHQKGPNRLRTKKRCKSALGQERRRKSVRHYKSRLKGCFCLVARGHARYRPRLFMSSFVHHPRSLTNSSKKKRPQ
ncbi:hypothetical protein CR513_06024, partial [Mucuna pruriens]